MTTSPRLDREKKTLRAMVDIYCRGVHRGDTLCRECAELYAYAMARLDKCPFGAAKPKCAACTVHCYKPAMRERVREVMRYAGPRMLTRHPGMALRHALDGAVHKPAPNRKTV